MNRIAHVAVQNPFVGCPYWPRQFWELELVEPNRLNCINLELTDDLKAARCKIAIEVQMRATIAELVAGVESMAGRWLHRQVMRNDSHGFAPWIQSQHVRPKNDWDVVSVERFMADGPEHGFGQLCFREFTTL